VSAVPALRVPPPGVPLARLSALVSFAFSIPLVHAVMEPGLLGAKVLELAADDRNTALGGLTFVGLSVAMVTQPIVGALSDRTRSGFGRRLPWMALGCALCAVAGALTVIAPVFWALVLAYGGLQLATNTIQGPWQALVPDEVPRASHGRAAAIKSVLEMVSAVAGRAACGEILSHQERWGRLALWLALGMALVSLAVTLGIVGLSLRGARDAPGGLASPASEASRSEARWGETLALFRASLWTLRADVVFRLWFVNRMLFWGAFITVSTFLLFFVIDVLRFPEAEAQSFVGRVSALIGVMLVAAVLAVGWLSDRLGRKSFLIAGGVLACLGAGVLLVLPGPAGAMAGASLVALGCGLYMAASWALITETVPEGHAAQALGIANVATSGASALVRLPAGALIDAVNEGAGSTSAGYRVVYGLAALAFLLSALVATRLPRAPLAPRADPPPPAPV
jgi:MFS family permease